MNLRLVEHNGGALEKAGILIKGASPLTWLKEIERMQFNIDEIEVFPIPSNVANQLYACLIIGLPKHGIDLGPNILVRQMRNQLYLPDNTAVYPSLIKEDFEKLFKDSKYFMHPFIGVVELNSRINFEELISCEINDKLEIKKPLKGVYIPSNLKAFRLDIAPEDVMKSMFSDIDDGKEEENLPFNMKKVLKGNEREIEKYLDFLDKNPHLAMKYAVPLDLIGTSRGEDFGEFYFSKEGWWPNIVETLANLIPNWAFNQSSPTGRKESTKSRNGVLILLFVLLVLGYIGRQMQSPSKPEIIHVESLLLDSLRNDSTVESTFIAPPIQEPLPEIKSDGGPMWPKLLIAIGLFLLLFLIFKYLSGTKVLTFSKGKKPIIKGGGGDAPPASILPVNIDWDSLSSKKEIPKNQEEGFYFGKNDYTPLKGLLAYSVLFGSLYYLFYPILERDVVGPWYTIAFILLSIALFRLIRADKTFLKPEADKFQGFKDKMFNVVLTIFFLKLIVIGSFFFSHPFSKFIVQFVLFVVFTFLGLLLLTIANSKADKSRSGSALIGSESMSKLNQKYLELANEFIKNKEYQKAAYIHMKLLQNPYQAAKTLEDGKLYSYAANIYLNKCLNKEKAAVCYELALQDEKAIKLYLELGETEKVGDIYMRQKNEEKAFQYYDEVIENYKKHDQYLKAALVARTKKGKEKESKSILLSGWRLNKDSYNCLNNYFAGFKNEDLLSAEIEKIYTEDVDSGNRIPFLKVLKKEYPKHEKMKDKVRKFAYEIISNLSKKNYKIVEELKYFNPKDKQLKLDINKYKNS